MPTPHIAAQVGEIAKKVIMPGDPLRAKFIAENFLENAKLINEVRGMLGYTGTYQGELVTVMGHGMGTASAGIYIEELYKFFDVETIIRVGSCGGVRDDIKLHDIILAISASNDSNYVKSKFGDFNYAPHATYKLLETANNLAIARGQSVLVENVFTTEVFYACNDNLTKFMQTLNIPVVEMEASVLYALAAYYKRNALCILTVSDHIITHESMDAKERQLSFNAMIKLGLDTIVNK